MCLISTRVRELFREDTAEIQEIRSYNNINSLNLFGKMPLDTTPGGYIEGNTRLCPEYVIGDMFDS